MKTVFIFRRLRYYNVCSRLNQIFFQSVIDSKLFAVMMKKPSSFFGLSLDNLQAHMGSSMRDKIRTILSKTTPFYDELWQMGSTCSHRLLFPKCKMVHQRQSY